MIDKNNKFDLKEKLSFKNLNSSSVDSGKKNIKDYVQSLKKLHGGINLNHILDIMEQ